MAVCKSEIGLSSTTFPVFCILLCIIPNLEARNRVFNESSVTGGDFGEEEYSNKEIEPRYFVPIRFGTVVPARPTTLPPCATAAACCKRVCPGDCAPTAPQNMRCAAVGAGGTPSGGMACYDTMTTACPQCTAVTCPATGPVPPNPTAICMVPSTGGNICP